MSTFDIGENRIQRVKYWYIRICVGKQSGHYICFNGCLQQGWTLASFIEKNVNQDTSAILLFVEKCPMSLTFWKSKKEPTILTNLTTVNSCKFWVFVLALCSLLTAFAFRGDFLFMLSLKTLKILELLKYCRKHTRK